jgi:drug/metabolite transporter (DMT)-like permease
MTWGTTWYGVSLQVHSDVPTTISVAWRFLLAAAVLFIWIIVRGKPLRFPLAYHRNWLIIGLFLFCLNYISVYQGSLYLPSGLVALVFSTITIFTIFNGALLFNKPIVARTMVGSIIGVTGLAVVFAAELWRLDIKQSLAWDTPILAGLMWSLLATFIASLGMLTSGKIQARKVPLLQSNAYSMLYGSLMTLLIAYSMGEQVAFDTSLSYTGSLLFLAISGSVIGFGAYLKLLNNIGADKAAYANVFTPITALTISALLEDYTWTLSNVLGVMLIIVGNIVVVYKQIPATKP